MNPSDPAQRFAELDAARALGDLSPTEQREWTELQEAHGFVPDLELDALVADLEFALPESDEASEVTLPSGLQDKLRADAVAFEKPSSDPVDTPVAPVIPFWQHPALGWAAAAVLAVLLYVGVAPRGEPTPSPEAARSALLAEAADAVQLDFAGVADFAGVSGDVVWTDTQQAGFMRLNGLPANDPTQRQYQLWIVDPERDARPVDGGVFDIPAGATGDVVVPINAALAVDQPVAFVITVEKPGGVVVSSQETVAAIAQRG